MGPLICNLFLLLTLLLLFLAQTYSNLDFLSIGKGKKYITVGELGGCYQGPSISWPTRLLECNDARGW